MRHAYDDLTLIVPYRLESPERRANFLRCLDYFSCFEGLRFVLCGEGGEVHLPEHLDSTRILLETLTPGGEFFHKTALINHALKSCKTEFFGVLDCDIICPDLQLRFAIEALREKLCDFIYPYDGTFVDIPAPLVDRFLDHTLPTPHDFDILHSLSVGGLILGRTSCYREAGGENQNFRAWGPEDAERHERLMALGFKVARVQGALFHMGHPRGLYSSPSNPHFESNNLEFERIKSLSPEQLQAEVRSWAWRETSNAPEPATP